MSARAPKPRYERQVASDRQEALIEAAIDSLKRHGHEGLSVRRIAAEAGVSIGLINHHFPNKDTLIAESYRTFSRRLSDSFEAAVESAGPEPRARLRAFFKAVFSRPNLDPQVLTAWVVYWALLQTSPEIRAIHDEEGRGYGDHFTIHSLESQRPAKEGSRLSAVKELNQTVYRLEKRG